MAETFGIDDPSFEPWCTTDRNEGEVDRSRTWWRWTGRGDRRQEKPRSCLERTSTRFCEDGAADVWRSTARFASTSHTHPFACGSGAFPYPRVHEMGSPQVTFNLAGHVTTVHSPPPRVRGSHPSRCTPHSRPQAAGTRPCTTGFTRVARPGARPNRRGGSPRSIGFPTGMGSPRSRRRPTIGVQLAKEGVHLLDPRDPLDPRREIPRSILHRPCSKWFAIDLRVRLVLGTKWKDGGAT